jgi:Na+-driven multidrug efflux pump
MKFLVPGIVAIVVHKVLNMDLAGRGKPYVALWSFLPALALNIVLNLLLIPLWGAAGAALATSASYGIAAVGFLIHYSRETQVPLMEVVTYSRADFEFVPRLLGRLSAKLTP